MPADHKKIIYVLLDLQTKALGALLEPVFASIRGGFYKPYVIELPLPGGADVNSLLALSPSGDVLRMMLKGVAADNSLFGWNHDVQTVLIGKKLYDEWGELLRTIIGNQYFSNSRFFVEDAVAGMVSIWQDQPVPVPAASVSASQAKLSTPIEELTELGVRAYHCLYRAELKTVGDLVRKTEKEILDIPNFGDKSLDEVTVALEAIGLKLGMTQEELDALDAPPAAPPA